MSDNTIVKKFYGFSSIGRWIDDRNRFFFGTSVNLRTMDKNKNPNLSWRLIHLTTGTKILIPLWCGTELIWEEFPHIRYNRGKL